MRGCVPNYIGKYYYLSKINNTNKCEIMKLKVYGEIMPSKYLNNLQFPHYIG